VRSEFNTAMRDEKGSDGERRDERRKDDVVTGTPGESRCGERAKDDRVGHTRPIFARMTYDEWEATASQAVKSDPTWKVEAYRLGLFAGASAWSDAETLIRDPRGSIVAGQLMRSAASVAAQIAEGYGRRSAKDRVRYYEYALGSVGETRAWYVTVRHAIGSEATEVRMANLLSLTRLLLTMIRREREKPADWMARSGDG